MKTAISIEDDLFGKGEELARELEISRSELYATALREYIKVRRDEAVTKALNRVYGDPASDDPEADAFGRAAIKRALASTEW
ncbi:ChpI protein [Deinococcus sp.]|uniref:ChpI protein n=1 Tax=Deinococcus sp. TaxID=47478 RepID=UPI0025E27569|nr:ChpI protein [Deinococcus sp.]